MIVVPLHPSRIQVRPTHVVVKAIDIIEQGKILRAIVSAVPEEGQSYRDADLAVAVFSGKITGAEPDIVYQEDEALELLQYMDSHRVKALISKFRQYRNENSTEVVPEHLKVLKSFIQQNQ